MRESTPTRARPGTLAARMLAVIIAGAFALVTGVAGAQTSEATATAPAESGPAPESAPAPTSPPQPTVVELKAAAYDAQEAARAAQAAAEQASAAAEAARQAVQQATGAVPAPVVTPAATPPPAPAPAAAEVPVTPSPSVEELRRAREEAENAAAAARAATAALEQYQRERKARYSRSGLYVSGGVFWAPELFDTNLSVANSRGAFGAIGYHLGERFDIEGRFDAIDAFELASPRGGYVGRTDGWAATLNGRIFVLTDAFQPYVGMGLGAMELKTRYTEIGTGRRVDYDDVVAVFRISAGFDFYLTEHVALTGDAAFVMPGGEVSAANFATLGGGLKLRF